MLRLQYSKGRLTGDWASDTATNVQPQQTAGASDACSPVAHHGSGASSNFLSD